jgi:hypothetical protein
MSIPDPDAKTAFVAPALMVDIDAANGVEGHMA